MDRRIRISMGVLAVLVLGYPIAAWLIGLAAEHSVLKREQLLLERYPYLDLVKRDYHGGVYSSTEELTYRLRGPWLQSLGALSGSVDLTRFQVTLRNTIHHGPLPQMRAFAPATVDSEVILPPDVRAKLAELLGNQAAPAIHTQLHWLGGSTTEVHSAAFERNASDGASVTWRGLDGTDIVARNLDRYNANFTAGGISMKSAAGNLEIENLRFLADRRAAFEDVYVGPFNLRLDRIEIAQITPDRKFSIRNISLDGHSSVQGEYLDMDAKVTADALQVANFATSRLGYEIHAGHIHGPSLSAFDRSIAAAQAQGSDRLVYLQKVQDALKTDGVEILLRDPVLDIPRIDVVMPEGELLVSLKVTVQGLTRAELEGPPALLRTAFTKHTQASADLRIDTALLDKLLDSTGRGDKLAAPLQGLQRQGYLKLDGKSLTTHLTYRNGQLEVNGLSFPAVGPMPQGTGP